MNNFYASLSNTWDALQVHPLVTAGNTSEEHLETFIRLFNEMIQTPFEKTTASVFRWLQFQTCGLNEALYEEFPALILLKGTRDITDALAVSDLVTINYSNNRRCYVLSVNGVEYVPKRALDAPRREHAPREPREYAPRKEYAPREPREHAPREHAPREPRRDFARGDSLAASRGGPPRSEPPRKRTTNRADDDKYSFEKTTLPSKYNKSKSQGDILPKEQKIELMKKLRDTWAEAEDVQVPDASAEKAE
jgi:hypothetical protein